MSQYYITPTEGTSSGTSISVSRFNQLAKNHPSSSVTSNTMSNSKISDLGNIYYKYLFSEKIRSLNKNPIKFSDFNTSMFFAIEVSMIPEYPEKYGRYNNGKLKITPIGGSGSGFKARIGYGVMEIPIIGYNTIETKMTKNRKGNYIPWNGNPKTPYRIFTKQIPIYGPLTFVEKIVYVNKTFMSGGSVETESYLDSGSDYFVVVEDLNENFSINKSFFIKNIAVGYDYSRKPIVNKYYFSR